LEGQVIEVREPTLPSEAEQQRIIADEGPDAVRTIKDEAGNITEVWVRWHQVSTFSLSGPADRHYVLDRIAGRLLFGDGVRGLIPPPGKDTIKVAVYRSGGGEVGNCAPNTITELKTTFPFVDKVLNYEAAAGGSDQEDIGRVTVNGPRLIKSRDRAVTVEDFEWLARQASSEVSKTRCLPLTRASSLEAQKQEPGWITVIVVPQGQEDQPLPTQGLIKSVKDYLTARSLTTLSDRIEIIGPRYVPIAVEAEVIPERIEDAKAVEKRVLDSLRAFLHPLHGGADGNGWEFGRDVYLSEIAAVIQGTEGVDRVSKVILRQGEQQVQDRVAIESTDLPASGDHRVIAVGS
jgi:predicted phage baseplate assembly protein